MLIILITILTISATYFIYEVIFITKDLYPKFYIKLSLYIIFFGSIINLIDYLITK